MRPSRIQKFSRIAPAFTLIELLIVVAIIAILAAIAVPNFLQAQTRAKVSRAKMDFRTIAVALESYVVDHNRYPVDNRDVEARNGLHALTTPTVYLSTIPWQDPFLGKETKLVTEDGTTIGSWEGSIFFYNYAESTNPGEPLTWASRNAFGPGTPYRRAFMLQSAGPDQLFGYIHMYGWDGAGCATIQPDYLGVNSVYDPTNGAISGGDIGRYGGEAPPVPCGMEVASRITG
ncbi:MAG: prepilin-type N-terminal cleavage/methylation domain-containing protein [Sumerlaeia bacterium]